MSRTARITACGLAVALLAPAPASAQEACIQAASLISSGVGKDAIPALFLPETVGAAAGDAFWEPTDMVLGVVRNGVARAYPIPILWWHEIINDNLGGDAIAVSYCPLTGSGLVYDRVLDGETTTFGTSGLLFDNNLVMYDRTKRESLWSQMGLVTICDTPRENERPRTYELVETSWAAWKAMYPQTTVVTRNTGHDRDYDSYPYGDYDDLDSTQLLYPHSFIDERLPMKAVVHGVAHEGVARAYSLDSLAERGERLVINDVVNGRPVLIVFDLGTRTLLSFDRRPLVQKKNGKWRNKTLKLELVEGSGFPFTLRDRRSKTLFTLSGKAIDGKLADRIEGGALQQMPGAYTAFWFAWAAFNRDSELY